MSARRPSAVCRTLVICLLAVLGGSSADAQWSSTPKAREGTEQHDQGPEHAPPERRVAEDPELTLAVRDGDAEQVAELLRQGAVVDEPGVLGRTALMLAASSGRTDLVRTLLDAGAEPDARDAAGSSALFYLPPEGRSETTTMLLAAGAAVDAENRVGLRPLAVAAQLGRHDVVDLLLHWPAGGADPNAAPPNTEPPLARALLKGYTETGRLLLEAGANVNPPLGREVTLLYRLTVDGNTEGVRLLLEHGADPDPRVGKEGEFPRETPLLAAARLGHTDIARLLLDNVDAAADTTVLDEDGKTPLAVAAVSGDAEIARMLLEHGADIEELGAEKSRTTPLGFAAMHGNLEVVELLLGWPDGGARVNVENRSDVTPLMLASFEGAPDVVARLLEAGGEVNAENRDGVSALLFAVLMHRSATTRLLLEVGASTDVRASFPEFGFSDPMMLAAARGHLDSVEMLIEHGAAVDDPSQMDEIGRVTPLMMAARAGFTEVVRVLLDHGADPNREDDDGLTAIDWARQHDQSEVIDLLEAVSQADSAAPADRRGSGASHRQAVDSGASIP